MITLINYTQGNASCEHCGREIKNLFIIDNDGIKMTVGSECVQTLLNTNTLPKNFKSAETEYKNAKFNASIVNMISNVHQGFKNSDIGKSLINGKRKATDNAVVAEILKKQTYKPVLDDKFSPSISFYKRLSDRGCSERLATEEEYIADLQQLELKYVTKYLGDFSDTKECQAFLNKLTEYAEQKFTIWGWTVKYCINRRS